MLTVIRCPFCAGMYEVLQPPVAGALLRCPNCRQTFTFGPRTEAKPLGAMPPMNLPQLTAPAVPVPDFPTPFARSLPPLAMPTPSSPSPVGGNPFGIPIPSPPPAPEATVPSGPRLAAPAIHISIPTITNPNSRPVCRAVPPDLPGPPEAPPGHAGP
jgi:hypothetical protein